MPSIGEILAGRYRLDALIGSGGFATVFRARDLRLERDVALKVLLPGHRSDGVIAARFEQEARALAAIVHPNVVAIHDVGPADPSTDGEPFLVMDLCEGGSLSDRLAASANGALQPEELVPILIDVVTGLAALHAIGIVHRDLKPSNILLAHAGARIADLGIAVVGPSDLTSAGTTVGTLAYLAPELLSGEPATRASDVHALGVVAFLGLTGTLPRPAGSVVELVAASRLPVPLVSATRPDLGSAFDAVIASMLSVDPSGRPSAADLETLLASALAGWRAGPGRVTPVWDAPTSAVGDDATTQVDVALPGPADPVVQPEATRRREPRMAALVTTLAIALSIALAALLVLGFGGLGGKVSPTIAGGAGTTASPSVTLPSTAGPPSPSAASHVPSVVPTTVADAYGEARAASDAMRTAISESRGGGGLKGHEAKDLEERLGRVDRALDKRDAGAARHEAGTLAARVAELIRQHAVDAQVGAGLASAADRLVRATNALPD
jgi:eukaryotic-like serine/threonine-protein kinase